MSVQTINNFIRPHSTQQIIYTLQTGHSMPFESFLRSCEAQYSFPGLMDTSTYLCNVSCAHIVSSVPVVNHDMLYLLLSELNTDLPPDYSNKLQDFLNELNKSDGVLSSFKDFLETIKSNSFKIAKEYKGSLDKYQSELVPFISKEFGIDKWIKELLINDNDSIKSKLSGAGVPADSKLYDSFSKEELIIAYHQGIKNVSSLYDQANEVKNTLEKFKQQFVSPTFDNVLVQANAKSNENQVLENNYKHLLDHIKKFKEETLSHVPDIRNVDDIQLLSPPSPSSSNS
ncbi:MAG: hypothetical protein CMF41_03275 [Legionellales bacterium]|nr:hypothetical protein [Legionellales bacterium]|tara:strand:+ start:1332 stop:2189 length:858 start_codon:yes stop_codon:yes gene_type:complete